MENKKIEQLAAETILESGVRVKLPAPLFLQFFGKKEIQVVIRQPFLGTLMHMSKLALKAGFNLDEIDQGKVDAAHELLTQHGKTIARIAAVAILRKKWRIRLFANPLASWMLWKMKPTTLVEMVLMLVTLSGVQHFTTSIRLIKTMRVTMPKNLSPTDQGSHEDEQSASIAPGEPSGPSPKQPAGQ